MHKEPSNLFLVILLFGSLLFTNIAVSYASTGVSGGNIYENSDEPGTVVFKDGNLSFSWQPAGDLAKLSNNGSVVWQGGLLPGFWIKDVAGNTVYLKAATTAAQIVFKENKWTIPLQLEAFGTGTLVVEKQAWGLRFSELSVEWRMPAPAIIEMYIGTSMVKGGANVPPTWDRPFMPDWQAFGYCLPGAKGGTVQSFFRSWDLGHANLALGNFGPSMGTPYGAAFPRPVLYAGMGSDAGWITIGAGSVPDGALSLKLQSTRSCFQYLYREDLWGIPAGKVRVWKDLLRITADSTARASFEKYYSSFPAKPKAATVRPAAIWNTWGMWRQKKYPIRPIVDFMQQLHNEIMVLDDPWESSQGSGKPNLNVFPAFYQDLDYIRNKKADVGVWETVGWIKDTAACGLGSSDLILDKFGKPCMANWNFDPTGDAYYCLDVSSVRTREFVMARTRKIMLEIKPRLIKLDFGYGLPNPNMGVPRNPLYRGEKYSFELMQLIATTAKKIDPNVIIMGYSISPLWAPVTDMVSLDDQGDLWYDLDKGHQEWSVWASLLSGHGVSVNGSSCYDWKLDDGILMNSVILGSPGAVLPGVLDNGNAVPDQYLNRRLAVNLWYRRSVFWEPVWFNSFTGNMSGPPKLRCWGREEVVDGRKVLTAIALRDSGQPVAGIKGMTWQGNWAIIAQDDRGISDSKSLAVIPFTAGNLKLFYPKKPLKVTRQRIQGIAPAEEWAWKSGVLTITVSQAKFEDTAGFLIE